MTKTFICDFDTLKTLVETNEISNTLDFTAENKVFKFTPIKLYFLAEFTKAALECLPLIASTARILFRKELYSDRIVLSAYVSSEHGRHVYTIVINLYPEGFKTNIIVDLGNESFKAVHPSDALAGLKAAIGFVE